MSRLHFHRRIRTNRLLLEWLEERNLFDVAMGSFLGGGLIDPLATLAATHDINGLPLGRSESGHPVILQAGPERLVGTRNGSVVTITETVAEGLNASLGTGLLGLDRQRIEPRRPSGPREGTVQMSWLGETRQVVPGHWVVQLDASLSAPVMNAASFDQALAARVPGLHVTSQNGLDSWFRISAPSSYTAADITSAVGQVASVRLVQPEFADYAVMSVPNDPWFPYQNSLNDEWILPDADIDAPEAWAYLGPDRGSTSVVVALIDTGVDYTHPDLYRNIWINQTEIPSWVVTLDTDGDGIITFWDLNDSANEDVVTDLNGTGFIDAGDILFPDFEGGWHGRWRQWLC